MKKGLTNVYMSLIEDMYKGMCTKVKVYVSLCESNNYYYFIDDYIY